MKWLIICISVFSFVKSSYQDRESESYEGTSSHSHGRGKDIFSFHVKDHSGRLVSMEEYRGKVLLVVNVASECGFTDRSYKGLVKLQKLLGKSEKFQILAFPCNQFGAQEPKSTQEILKFAKETYQVNFPIMEKINVVDSDVPELFQYLIENTGVVPTWNFYKYLITHTGNVQKGWGPWSDIDEIFPHIKQAVTEAIRGADAEEASGPNRPADSKVKPPAPSQNRNGIVGPPPPGGGEKDDEAHPEGGIAGDTVQPPGKRPTPATGNTFRGEAPTVRPNVNSPEPRSKRGQPKPPEMRKHDDL